MSTVHRSPAHADAAGDQHGPWDASSQAPTCLVTLCGLPASGKTSLARQLVDEARGWASESYGWPVAACRSDSASSPCSGMSPAGLLAVVHHVSFDEYLEAALPGGFART